MNLEEQAYLDLLKHIIENGNEKSDRTNIGTRSIFGATLRFSLENNTIPAFTTKKIFFKGVIEELLFFLRGETNSKILENKNVNIWKGNTSRDFLDKRGLTDYPEGEMGPMYGAQWRNWDGEVDQIKKIINLLKTDPNSRRMLVSACNVNQLDKMVIELCHPLWQVYVNDNKIKFIILYEIF